MRITQWILNGLALVIAAIMLLKLVVWLATDYPISRGSMLILACFVVFLSVKNSYTFILLACLVSFCLSYRPLHMHLSGYTIIDFTSSIRNTEGSVVEGLMYIPDLFYLVMFVFLLLPWTWKVYFSRSKSI